MGNHIIVKKKETCPPKEIGIPWEVLEEHVMQFLEPRDINVFHAATRRSVNDRIKKMVLKRFGIEDEEEWM